VDLILSQNFILTVYGCANDIWPGATLVALPAGWRGDARIGAVAVAAGGDIWAGPSGPGSNAERGDGGWSVEPPRAEREGAQVGCGMITTMKRIFCKLTDWTDKLLLIEKG